MTRKQLVRKVASLIQPKTFKTRIGPSNYIHVTIQWLSDTHPEIININPPGWENCIFAEDMKDNFFKINLSKFREFDKQVQLVCEESDKQAKENHTNGFYYFEQILSEAEDLNNE